MKTAQWEILKVFEKPIEGKNISFKKISIPVPEGIDDIARQSWDNQLLNKKAVLSESGIETEIRPYKNDDTQDQGDKDPLNALYEKEELKMWPGNALTLNNINDNNGKIELEVAPISFPYIRILREEKVKSLYAKQNIQIPRPPIAICTFCITTDNQIVLTLRSTRVNVYPKRLYGQGGNPETADTGIVEHQLHEIEDEILVTSKDYNEEDFRFAGIVVDKDQFVDKTDLIGWIPVNLSANEIQERVSRREIKKRPGDAAAVVFAPSDPDKLMEFLTLRTHPFQYCPPAHAGLMLYGLFNFGKEWVDKVLDMMHPITDENNFLRNLK